MPLEREVLSAFISVVAFFAEAYDISNDSLAVPNFTLHMNIDVPEVSYRSKFRQICDVLAIMPILGIST